MSFFDELKRRKLFQWGIAYLAGAWVVLQVLDVIGDKFGWPVTLFRAATIILAVGFPGALVVAWFHGERGRQRVHLTELVVLGALSLIAAAGVVMLPPEPGAVKSARSETSDANSIAVLPFTNLSDSKEDEYFSDGLAEELLNLLARIDGLKVSARTSSFAFKGRNLDVRAIGDSLGVSTVLEGSVRRDGQIVRVTAQLISVADGYHLWSDQFDARPNSIFKLQEQIARSIADALEIKLGRADALTARGTTSPDAHDSYLLGLSKFSQRGPALLREALQYFERAVAADSNYAQAWGGIALVNAVMPVWEGADPAVAGRRTRQAADRAIALDSTIAEPYAALCQSLALGEWRWVDAEHACNAAIVRNPNFATAHQWRGELLSILGRFDSAKAAFERAQERDPRSVTVQFMAALAALPRGDTAAVLRDLAVARALDPSPIASSVSLGALLVLGDTATLRSVLAELNAPPDHVELLVKRLHDPAARTAVLAALDPPRGTGLNMDRAYNRALVGDWAATLDYLEKAYERHEFNLPHALRLPLYAPFRNDPRFRRIIKGMGLERYW